jgi:thiol-disulfide isomerase/thioredoxin
MSLKSIEEINLSPALFEEMLEKNNGIILFKFGATWCNPCKQIEPHLNRFASGSPQNIKCYNISTL